MSRTEATTEQKSRRFRFSLRTLLILTAMLAVLFAQWPWTKIEITHPTSYGPQRPGQKVVNLTFSLRDIKIERRVLTPRFKYVAIAEGVILAAWAGFAFLSSTNIGTHGRWIRFSLRSLLIGVAVLSIPAAYIGHEWQVVQERWRAFYGVCPCEFDCVVPPENWLRHRLGDREYRYIRPVPQYVTQSKIDIARAAFPEAVIDYDLQTIQAQLEKKKLRD